MRCGKFGHFAEKCSTPGEFPSVLDTSGSRSFNGKPMLRLVDDSRWPGKAICFYESSQRGRCDRVWGFEMYEEAEDKRECCRHLHVCSLCGDPQNDGHWFGMHFFDVQHKYPLHGLIAEEQKRREERGSGR